MGVGFSLLSSTLTINGTASVSGTWDVHITGIEAVEGTYKGTSWTGTTAGSTGAKFDLTSGTLSDANDILGVKTFDANSNVLF